MAQVEESGSDRESNVELNLVPFIDLMSVMITFLLITAVWSQISMIQIGSSIYGKKTEDTSPTPPSPGTEIVLRVDVRADGYKLVYGTKEYLIARKADRTYDSDELLAQLQVVKEKYPDKKDAVITVEDKLTYDHLIVGMDQILEAGFPQISVAAYGEE